MALAMDFAFLLDPERKLLSIGYSLADNRLDPSCYDLLASEARLASLFAIAKGDAPTRHWFRLGRTATPLGSGSALISWSGSMFEYLMPSLVMRAPAGSLLEQTNRLVVRAPAGLWRVAGHSLGHFGIGLQRPRPGIHLPVLQLRRAGPRPEARPGRQRRDRALRDGAGRHGRSRAARCATTRGWPRWARRAATASTRRSTSPGSRLPDDAGVAIVRSFMAHHQGMTIVAIANALQDGRMRERFHREPMIQASELLLQERMPRDVAVAHPRAEEVKASPAAAGRRGVRRCAACAASAGGAPVTHLLSNGRYAVMLTAAGRGLQPLARHRRDALARGRDPRRLGLVRLSARHRRAAPSGRPARSRPAAAPEHDEVIFGEDHAEFIRRDGTLTTTHGGAGLRRGRRRGAARVADQQRPPLARDRAHLLCRAGADDAGRRQRASGLRQDVRADRVPAGIRRAHRDPPAALARRSADLGGALRGGRRRGDGRHRSTRSDRARFIGRGRSVGVGRGHGRRRAAVEHRRHRARPDLLAAPAGADRARQVRAGRLLDHRRALARRAAAT